MTRVRNKPISLSTSSRTRAGVEPEHWSSSVYRSDRNLFCLWLLTLSLLICSNNAWAQKKRKTKPKPAAPAPVTELAKLREEYVNKTKEYKSSLEKLLLSHQAHPQTAQA